MFSRRVFRKFLARLLNCYSCALASATLIPCCSSVCVCVTYTRRNLRVSIVYTSLSASLYTLGLGWQFCLLVISHDIVFDHRIARFHPQWKSFYFSYRRPLHCASNRSYQQSFVLEYQITLTLAWLSSGVQMSDFLIPPSLR